MTAAPSYHAIKDMIALLDKLSGVRVLVVGDVMLDRFVYGTVTRISPESPVPVLKRTREASMLGGAGNALASLAGLGVQADFISLTGSDEAGQEINKLVEALPGVTSRMITDDTRLTTVKTRFLAGHQQVLRTDMEDDTTVPDSAVKAILDQVRTCLDTVQAVILSDYNKGVLRSDAVQEIIALAKEKDIPVLVDPKSPDFSIYAGAGVITPNKKELALATSGMPVQTDEEVVKAARSLISAHNIKTVMATRSADGLSIISAEDPPLHIRNTSRVEVFDVSGAGDAVVAVTAALMGAGGSWDHTGYLANMAGSLVVSKVGTAPIKRQNLKSALHDDHANPYVTSEDWDQALEQVRRWKSRGLKIGFTNGCFDILHLGHVSYLNDTRRHCDRLIIGLNKDTAVRLLKGEGRPIHDERSRAGVLNALSSVDMVVLFGANKDGDDNTACALLSLLEPDIYFKGGDYTLEQIPEAPTVQAYGGTVNIMPVYDGHSTTRSVSKMHES